MESQLDAAPWLKIHQELGVAEASLDERPLRYFIEQHALQRPDHCALRYLGRTFSYQQLNEEANRLASALAGLGVARGDVVGFHMPNIPQYVIGYRQVIFLWSEESNILSRAEVLPS